MLIFNDRNIEYLETMRVCDVIEKSTITDRYFSEKTIKTLRSLLSILWKPDYWNMTPLHNKTVSLILNIGDDDVYRSLIINEDGSMYFNNQ